MWLLAGTPHPLQMEMKTIVVIETIPALGAEPVTLKLLKSTAPSEVETAQTHAEMPGHKTRFSFCPTEGEQS